MTQQQFFILLLTILYLQQDALCAFLPGEKLNRECTKRGGALHIPFKTSDSSLLFRKYPGTNKQAPISKNDYICLQPLGQDALNLTGIVIPIPGAPVPYLIPQGDEDVFTKECHDACDGKEEEDYGTSVITFKGQTLGLCTCYKDWPTSPKLPNRQPLLDADEDGRFPGLEEPMDPFTFQTCSEFSSHYPIQGLFNMACVCHKNDWPFADMSSCKWAGDEPKVVDVAGSPAVWISDEGIGGLDEGCPDAADECRAACGVDSDTISTTSPNIHLACFNFISQADRVSIMCQCPDGSYPKSVPNFKAMSSVGDDGKVPGDITRSSGALQSVGISSAVTLLSLMSVVLF